MEGGIGYSDLYSLANNAYWYVNEYEGLDLYKLLLYLGMNDAKSMGLAASRTTLVRFIADDGFFSPESFSIDTLSYPDTFGFYNKNAMDPGDGSYAPTNADLVRTGYPVLLAYGLNGYPYTITKQDAGYLSGLSNNGGPMRVVFGKTQYNHPNGSNQVQYLKDVIVGKDILYNTHKYTDAAEYRALADDTLTITVSGEDGGVIQKSVMTVGDVEDILYGEDVSSSVKNAARVKDHYQQKTKGGYASEIYEGINFEYFLMEVLGLPGTNGTVTILNANGETVTVPLSALLRTGYNTELGRDKLSPVIAFAKIGSPMVAGVNAPGYIDSIPLNPMLESEPMYYAVENSSGPLAVFIPSSDPHNCNAVSISNVTSITIDLDPDSYAHLRPPYSSYGENTIRFYGDGLERDMTYTVSEIESRQRLSKTLDYSLLNDSGKPVQHRYRGVPVYDLLVETGIKSNAGDVIFYDSGGGSCRYSLAALKRKNYLNQFSPEKEPLTAILAYGTGLFGENTMAGLPLVPASLNIGYEADYGNDGGPLKLVIPGDSADTSATAKNIAAVEVTANEIDLWGHLMSDIYNEFLDSEFTLTIKNDDSEWSCVFTVGQLEGMTDLIVREKYSVLNIGECEGIDIWKFIRRFAGNVPGIEDPVAITVYAGDGYKNDLLSVFHKEGFELGVDDGDGNRKPLIIAYAVNGLPLVDSESHEGYTGLAGNGAGPLRVIAETNQGATVKYAGKLVVTVPGSGPLDSYISQNLLP
jgi:DMSO/TMAO reductase YedYZ molybdopterin-dependent catalytic subunit